MKLNLNNNVLTKSLMVLCALLLSACSTPDNSEPPAELIEIENAIATKQAWSSNVGTGVAKRFVDLQPLLIGDKVYTIDSKGNIRQIDAQTGRKDWAYDSGLSAATGLSGNSTYLIATSSEGDMEKLKIIEDGLVSAWKTQLKSEIRSSAVLNGEQIFVRTVDGRVSALNSQDGSLIWAVSRRVPALSLTGNSHPLVTDELVISGFDNGKLVALDRETASTVWETSVGIPRGRTEIERLVDLDGQFILRDGVIYVSSFQGNLAAITLNSGQVIWNRKFSSFKNIEADDEALYLTDDKSHVWSVDRRTGSAFWKQDELNARKLTAPTLIDGHLVVADLNGYIHFLSKLDGKIVARIKPNDERVLSQPVAYKNSALVLDASNQLASVSLQR